MKDSQRFSYKFGQDSDSWRELRFLMVCLFSGVLLWTGCGVFNAAFLNSLDATGSGAFASVDTPPGFVVITFSNNARVDERLLTHLENNGLVLTEDEKRALRPRVRLSVRVTFTDGSFQVVQFIDGSSSLIDPAFTALAFPDLNQNDLTNVAVVCDVASVTLEPGAPIEVFVPAVLNELELVETTGEGGLPFRTFEQRRTITPRFQALLFDEQDVDGFVLQRNIGIQDLPADVSDPVCGSFIGIVLDGTLSVPFHPSGNGDPSFDGADETTIGSIGGRYEFRVTRG